MLDLDHYLACLVGTLLLELPVVACIAGRRAVVDALLANLLTHPVAVGLYVVGTPLSFEFWYGVYTHLGSGVTRACEFCAIELVVVLVECLVFRWVAGLSWRRALTSALLANALSALASPDVLRWLWHLL